MKLTKATVEELKVPRAGADLHWDDELVGFGLRVTHNDVRSYVAQARVNGSGRTRRVTVGRHGVITAEEARRKARIALGKMSDGIDPITVKRRGKALSVTLRQVVEDYLQTRKTKDGFSLKERSKADIRRHLEHAFKDWADRPVVEITRDKVRRLHGKLSETAPAQAGQAFRILRALLNFARASHRMPDDSPIILENPVVVLSEAKLWHGAAQRNGHVPIEHLGHWWSCLQAQRADPGLTAAGKVGADVIAFLTLAGLRWNEAAQLTRPQVDLERATMHLPDPKNRQPVTLPLSGLALALLKARPVVKDPDAPDAPGYFFPGRGGHGYVNDARPTLRAVRDALAARAKEKRLDIPTVDVSPHDLRRTYVAIADKLGIERWRVKMLINHSLRSVADVTLTSYTNKTDRTALRAEADRIAAWIEEQRGIAEAKNVLPLKRKTKGARRA